MVISTATTSISLAYMGSTIASYTTLTLAGANNLRDQIAQASENSLLVLVDTEMPTIESITPSPFVATTATITIKGKNFVAGALGILYLGPGGETTPLTMTCTFVDSETLTAVFSDPGTLSAPSNISIFYMVDGAHISNWLLATFATGNVVTML